MSEDCTTPPITASELEQIRRRHPHIPQSDLFTDHEHDPQEEA